MQPTICLLVMDGTKLGSSLVPEAAFGGSILYGSNPFSDAIMISLSSPVACSSSVGTPPPEAIERVATAPQGLRRQSAHPAKFNYSSIAMTKYHDQANLEKKRKICGGSWFQRVLTMIIMCSLLEKWVVCVWFFCVALAVLELAL
ncbi:hypothetical protein STEG23_003479 [Scotinomys teguina]